MDRRRRLMTLSALAVGSLTLAACVPVQMQQGAMPNTGYGRPHAPPSYAENRGHRQACDTTIQVLNRSSSPVHSLHYSHSSRQNWGPDRLGQNQIPPGGAMTFRPQTTGQTDFRVVWRSGASNELRQVDICRVSQIIVTNRGLRAI